MDAPLISAFSGGHLPILTRINRQIIMSKRITCLLSIMYNIWAIILLATITQKILLMTITQKI